ncbi:Sec23/Sec24 zinc finger domain containing protein [Nitzschia inconspicua]|uniref:Sec23/Sec24 zinc finger domain containing protein n=1 Tax=Nitzschia inconspicua TaxID=303405 RepID=A0A9K3LQB2_9STRA|nr:Sec23/Sec24 zinc finger domain containing protein [Nitzschia inconspicua]
MSSWFGFSSSSKAAPLSAPDDGREDTLLAEDHPAYRLRADEGAVFTASKCPPGPGLENTCELPFGFLWSPMAIYNESLQDDGSGDGGTQRRQAMPIIQCSDHLPPVLCIACMAYMNPFCEMNYETGIWVCPLCGQENVAPLEQLQAGSHMTTALTYSCVEYRQPPQSDMVCSEKKKEEFKNSILEKNENSDDYCSYIFVVDENLAPKDGQAIAPVVEALLKVHSKEKDFPKIRIGLIVFGKSVWTYQLGLSGVTSSDLYVATDPTSEENLNELSEMDNRAYLAEGSYDESLTALKNAIASVFNNDMSVIETSGGNETSQNTSLFSPRMAMLSKRKEDRKLKEQMKATNGGLTMPTESPWVRRRKESKQGHPIRSTGEAVQCALDLASANISNPSRTSRIILFTNGCPNKGDGSVVAVDGGAAQYRSKKNGKRPKHDVVDSSMLQKSVDYFDMTGKIAVSNGIGFDVFCSGATELALPAYQALVEPSGGYVVPLLSFGTEQMEHNLRFLLDKTYMSRSKYIPEDMEDDDAGAECILDIRTDGFISPSQLCGSGEVLPGQASKMVENERPAFAKGSALAAGKGIKTNDLPSIEAMEMSMTRVQVGRVDPLTTFAVMLEVDDTMAEDDDYAFFQLVARYVSKNGNEEITRVCSFKLPVAKDVSDFVGSVDDEAVSVVLGKAAVYRAIHGREETSETRDIVTAGDEDTQEKLAYETQLDLDATIQRISGAYRLLGLEEKIRSLSFTTDAEKEKVESSLELAFPPKLQNSLIRLYHLRRSHLISPGPMRSMDDRAEVRSLFLRFPLEDCLKMMEPSLLSTGSLDGIASAWDVMQPFPAETLALWEGSIVAADFHDELFVWTGANCTAARYDGIRDKFKSKLLEITKHRFPRPLLHELQEGDSMSRRFTARLAPSHADPVDNQLLHFPALSTLKPASLQSLRSKFKFYDSNSDASFRNWFWGVASASNVSRLDGTSLCE